MVKVSQMVKVNQVVNQAFSQSQWRILMSTFWII